MPEITSDDIVNAYEELYWVHRTPTTEVVPLPSGQAAEGQAIHAAALPDYSSPGQPAPTQRVWSHCCHASLVVNTGTGELYCQACGAADVQPAPPWIDLTQMRIDAETRRQPEPIDPYPPGLPFCDELVPIPVPASPPMTPTVWSRQYGEIAASVARRAPKRKKPIFKKGHIDAMAKAIRHCLPVAVGPDFSEQANALRIIVNYLADMLQRDNPYVFHNDAFLRACGADHVQRMENRAFNGSAQRETPLP